MQQIIRDWHRNPRRGVYVYAGAILVGNIRITRDGWQVTDPDRDWHPVAGDYLAAETRLFELNPH
jgi:hypothetical protein